MRTKIYTVSNPKLIKPEILNQLKRLTFRGRYSLMRGNLMDFIHSRRKSIVSYILDMETGKVLSWGISTRYTNPRYNEMCFYTRRSARRMGYGTKVYRALRKRVEGKVYVYPHDIKSRNFFYKIDKKLITGNEY